MTKISKEFLAMALRTNCAFLLMSGIWQEFAESAKAAGNQNEVTASAFIFTEVPVLEKKLLTTISLSGYLDEGVKSLPISPARLFIDEHGRCLGRFSFEQLAEALLATGEAEDEMAETTEISGDAPDHDFFSVKAKIGFDLCELE